MHLKETIPQSPTTHPTWPCKHLLLSHVSFPTSVNKGFLFFQTVSINPLYTKHSFSLSHSAFLCVRHGFHSCHWFSCSFVCFATLDCFKLPFAPCFLSCLWFVVNLLLILSPNIFIFFLTF